MILSPMRTVAGDGGVGVICTDMAIKAMEWDRAPGGNSDEHLGNRHPEKLERGQKIRATGGHIRRGNREFQGGSGQPHQRLQRFLER